jgi:hypothetical protein
MEINKMKSLEQEFLKKSHPVYWYQVADELYDSLIFLYSENHSIINYNDHVNPDNNIVYPVISKSYFLLAGYCLENIIKALLLVENPDFIGNGKMNKKLLSHDLVYLFKMSKKIRVSKSEKELLAILSEATPYWGRYPIPRTSDKIKEEVFLDPDIHDCFMYLFKRVTSKLYHITKDGFIGLEGRQISGWDTNFVD